MRSKAIVNLLAAFCLLVGICCTAISSRAAGFDCNKASTKVEKMICGDQGLNDLDEQLSKAYRQVLATATNQEIDAMKQDQREWLKKRNQMNTAGELTELYLERIESLHEMIQSKSGNGQAQPAQAPQVQPHPEEPQQSVQAQTESAQQKQAEEPQQAVKTDTSQSRTHQEDHTWRNFFIILGILITLIITGIVMHQNNTITVFVDYTDAAMSLAALVVPPLSMLIISIFAKNASNYVVNGIAIILFIGLAFYPVKAAFVYNRTPALGLLAGICKIATAITYLIGLIAAFSSGEDSKQRDNETRAEYHERMARGRARQAFWLAVLHGMFLFIINATTRISDFSSEIFNLSFTNRYDEFMQRLDANNMD